MIIAELFSTPVYLYGLVLCCASLLAVMLMTVTAAKTRSVSMDALSMFVMLAIPMGVVFARVGYCLSRYEWFFQQEILVFLRFTDGGLMLYGALLGVGLAAWIASRITGTACTRLTDLAVMPGALMIAIVRMAEGPLGQGGGWSLIDWFDAEMGMSVFHLEEFDWLQRFPFAVMDYSEDWVWAVFVLEAIFALAIAVILMRTRAGRPGWKTMLFLLLYACTQILCESMRQDELLKWGFVRINQLISALVVAGILLICCMKLKDKAGNRKRMIVSWICLLVFAGVVIAAEFMLEKKIVFLEWIPMDMCYLIMAIACVGMFMSVLPLWRRSMKESGEADTVAA